MADKVIIEYDAEIRSMQSKLDQLIAKEKDLSKTGVEGQKQFQKELNTTGTNTDKLGNGFQKLGGYIAGAFAVSSLVAFGKEVVDVTRKTELLQNQLNFVAGSVEGGEKLFIQLQGQSRKLGLEFEGLAKGFSQFAVSSKQAGFSAEQSLVIYNKLAGGIRGSGASSEAATRAFYALEQMMSKGKVSSEELRQQMGEAIPGATAIAAKSMNMTTAEFNKLLETGQIISSEFIPAFADAVYNEFSPALSGKTNSLDASISRASNALEDFKRILGDKDFFKGAASVIATELERINALTKQGGLGAALGLFTSQRQVLVNQADALIATNQAVASGLDATTQEAIKLAGEISQLSDTERVAKEKELEQQEMTLKGLKAAGLATGEQIKSLNRIEQVKTELASIDKVAEENRKKAAEQRKADEATFLRNAIALAQIRVIEAKDVDELVKARRELATLQYQAEVAAGKKTAGELLLIRTNLQKDIEKIEGGSVDKIPMRTGETTQEDLDEEKERIQNHNNEILRIKQRYYNAVDKADEENAERAKQREQQQIQQFNESAQLVGGLLLQFSQTNMQLAENEARAAAAQQKLLLDTGVINEEEYQRRIAQIKNDASQKEKDAAIAQAKIGTALSIIQLFASTGIPFPLKIIAAVGLTALMSKQLSAIESAELPTFHDGGIDIGGDTKRTSGKLKPDEFVAKLQTGESVIDREDTRQYKADLMAMRNGNYQDYIAKHYIQPAIKRAQDKPQLADSSATSMEIAFQTAEMVNQLRNNKTVKLHKDTVEAIAKANRRASTADSVLNRRGWA